MDPIGKKKKEIMSNIRSQKISTLQPPSSSSKFFYKPLQADYPTQSANISTVKLSQKCSYITTMLTRLSKCV